MKVEMINLETAEAIPAKDIPTPKYHCASCAKMNSELRCDVFERRVEPDYNKCFNHSHYQPSFKSYVSPSKELFKLIEDEDNKNGGFKAA